MGFFLSPVRVKGSGSRRAIFSVLHTGIERIPLLPGPARRIPLPSGDHLVSIVGAAVAQGQSSGNVRCALWRDQRARDLHFAHCGSPSLASAPHPHRIPVRHPPIRSHGLITSLSFGTSNSTGNLLRFQCGGSAVPVRFQAGSGPVPVRWSAGCAVFRSVAGKRAVRLAARPPGTRGAFHASRPAVPRQCAARAPHAGPAPCQSFSHELTTSLLLLMLSR
jgi:hypothetical protein